VQTQQSNNGTFVFRIIAWIIALAMSCGVIFGSALMLGSMLFSIPGLGDRITVMVYCPDAISNSIEEGASTRTTTSPSEMYGHTVEITCTVDDGSQKVVTNEQVAIGSIGGVFGLGAVIGLCLSVPIMLTPLFIFRKRKKG
jgi:hypothetical protein